MRGSGSTMTLTKLRFLKKKYRISYAAIGRELGVSKDPIWKVLNGKPAKCVDIGQIEAVIMGFIKDPKKPRGNSPLPEVGVNPFRPITIMTYDIVKVGIRRGETAREMARETKRDVSIIQQVMKEINNAK